ncbi:hypothetical protein RP20_CCG011710 [Aedes albopictus]|nr:hypothetical protein RP20_CCG011710 [Aedes albopictus]
MSSIVDIIKHYQKSIDKSLNDEARLVHCIGKLYRLPVSVQHLKDTGIGRTVNGLRKYDGEVGVAAKALVSKWKNMVAAEESDTGEPDSQHHQDEEDHEEQQDEDNYDESRLQVDEDHHSDDHQEVNAEDEEDEEEEQHHPEEESDNQEELQEQQPRQEVKNDRDSDHRREKSSHRDSDRHHGSGSSGKHKSDRHSSSGSKDSSRSRDHHDKHRDGDQSKHHSSSKKSHSSPSSSSSSSRKSSSHGDEGKDRKDKHSSSSSSRKESSHTNGKESSHSCSSKDKTSDKHHSSKSSKEGLNGSGSSKEKDKKSSSEKKKESSSSSSKKKKKEHQSPENVDDEEKDEGSEFDNGGGASFADALAMIGMPSSSKKKSSSKGSADKVKISTSSSSMPPPPSKSDKDRSFSSSGSSKRSISPCSTASSSGYSSASSTPSLLAQRPSPLPVAEIVESLPMISPNYRPMPLNQTVMECVFSNNGRPQKRALTEEEALGQSMQSKNIRTKVYSGVKNFKGEVPTLYNLCIRLLQEHIDLIDYTGGIPFDLLKPVLERASPEQLFTLESYNPYLMEDSDVLWEQHIKRNFRSQKRKEEECESWREMFIRCSEERESKLLSLTANIKQSQVEKTAPIRKTQLAYVDSAVKPPRNIISKQARFGTAQAPVVSPAARVAALKNGSTNVAKAGDSRLKVAAGARDNAQVQVFQPTKPRKAPLMSKVMQSIKGFKGFRR